MLMKSQIMKDENLYFYWNRGFFCTTQPHSLWQISIGVYEFLFFFPPFSFFFLFYFFFLFQQSRVSDTQHFPGPDSVIRFISCTRADMALCLCSWGLLSSLPVHHHPLLTEINNSPHFLHQKVKVSSDSFSARASCVQMHRETAHRLVKMCLCLFKADQSFLSVNT